MNREIKFRAWDSKKKKMLQDVQNYHWCENCANEYNEGTEYPAVQHFGNFVKKQYEADRFEVMQFTGLKDKNGDKYLYEGDIVANKFDKCEIKYGKHEVTMPCEHFNTECEVIGFYLKTLDKYCEVHNLIEIESNEYEVIGNIYENPKLMEKSK